jgi:hypothetical protein
VLKNSFQGISIANFVRKLLNVGSPQALKFTEITALVPFSTPTPVSNNYRPDSMADPIQLHAFPRRRERANRLHRVQVAIHFTTSVRVVECDRPDAVAVAVTVYVPPGVPPPPPPLLPQPLKLTSENPTSSMNSIALPTPDLRFPLPPAPRMSRPGTTSAKKIPCLPPSGQRRMAADAADAAVVAKVSVVVAGPPFGFTLPGLNEQLAPVGNPLQLAPVKVMVWLNPPLGVIVIVVVPDCPGELMVTVVGLAPIVKSPEEADVTVSVSVVVCVKLPEVPVTVTAAVPVVAVPLAVSVSVLVLVAGFGLKFAVTPFGRPEAENDTLPLKPFSGVIVIVLVPWLPCATLKLFGLADSA